MAMPLFFADKGGYVPWAWGSGDALGVEFVKRPPDESADACVSLLIAPSYVTYVPEAVASVQQFFTTRRTLELATLQVQ
jgi:vacuolar protein sorting-associated protein 13A/C